jgi:hypothetical protein
MHTLRHSPSTALLVLMWFAATLGVAVASPLVNPQGMTLVCNAAGGVKLVSTNDGSTGAAPHTLDCPLCAPSGAPGMVNAVLNDPQRHLGHVLQSIPAARIAALTAAPLPARGPPTSF